MTGKVVMITGGAAGIGLACAREFAGRGALVSVNDKDSLAADGSGIQLFTRGDITDLSVRGQFLQRTLEKFGRVDILVNNAGIGLYAPACRTDLDDARRIFELNVFAALGMAQIVIPTLLRQGSGMIVNIDSIGGLVALPWSTMYCASKSALLAISQGMRRELHGSGIHVLTVIPGIVHSRFRENVISGTCPEGVANIRRIISPEGLAVSIAESVQRRRKYLYNPPIARLFSLANELCPWAMDLYIKRKWDGAGVLKIAPASQHEVG